MKKASQEQKLTHTFSGIKYELFIIMGSILTSYTYSWLDNKAIHEQLILVMLRVFIAFADLGIFLAIGHLIDFRRGIWVFYIYKILSILQMDKDKIQSQWQYVYETVMLPVCLILYYKVTLFLLIYTASHVVQMQHQQSIEQKIKNQKQQQKLNQQHEQEDRQKLFSRTQRKQLYDKQEIKRQQQQQQVSKTIRRIKLSLRFHKQNEFYKKLQVFYFIIYNSTCLMVLFPLQQHVLDFTKGVGFKDSKGNDLLLGNNTMVLDAANDQLRWVIDALTVMNVIGYWGIVMIGEFWIKTRYPQLIKQYISKIPLKFLLLQILSFIVMVVFLMTTPLISNNIAISQQAMKINDDGTGQQLQQVMLSNLINPWLFISCYLIHSVIPLLIIFLLYRLYLGLIYSLNHMVSTRFSYHQSSSHDQQQTNLDSVLYESITLNDINKVRHFIISPSQLLPRHKLKRYTEQQKLKHYLQENTIIEIQQMFEDFLVLDLYNKLSRWLAVWIFYLLMIVFVIGMTINDSHLLTQDRFFIHVPVILMIIGFLIVNKYPSQPNIFYPKYVLWLNDKYNQFLARNKAYHFIRMNHFYAIVFGIWLYRLYGYVFLQTHYQVEQQIKLRLYEYYMDDGMMENWLFKKLLYGWAKYFMTHTAQCDYDLKNVLIDTFMVGLVIAQLLMQKNFVDMKNTLKKDPILLTLKFITPLYAFYIFVIQMQCLQWSRVVFCSALCVGVMFIHLNWTELQRGIKRNQEGEFDD